MSYTCPPKSCSAVTHELRVIRQSAGGSLGSAPRACNSNVLRQPHTFTVSVPLQTKSKMSKLRGSPSAFIRYSADNGPETTIGTISS